MGDRSKIAWLDWGNNYRPATWNPVHGCTKISAGCDNCYAEKMAKRLGAMGAEGYDGTFAVHQAWEQLEVPTRWKNPRNIFVCSMGDLFHKRVSFDFISAVFGVIARNPRHRFFVLTKRPERMAKYITLLKGEHQSNFEHVFFGTSVENEATVVRIEVLSSMDVVHRFVSFEPLLGHIPSAVLALIGSGVEWVIVGGESGFGARKMEEEWALSIRSAAQEAGCQFYMKQLGSHGGAKKRDDISTFPAELRVRQFPRGGAVFRPCIRCQTSYEMPTPGETTGPNGDKYWLRCKCGSVTIYDLRTMIPVSVRWKGRDGIVVDVDVPRPYGD